MTNLLLIILALAAGLLALRNPKIAAATTVAATPFYIARFSLVGIPTNFWEILVGILFLTLCFKADFWNYLRSVKLPAIFVIGSGLVIISLIGGFVVAPDPEAALGIIKGWFLVPAIFVLCCVYIYRSQDPVELPAALLVGTLPLSSLAIWQALTDNFITIDQRSSAWFISPNYLSLFIVPVLLLSLSWLLQQTGWRRWTGWIVWGLGLVSIALSGSFGGWAALGAGVLVFVFLLEKSLTKIWLVVGSLGLVGFLIYLYNHRLQALFDLTQRTSGSVRLQVWEISLAIIKDHWLWGAGLGSFPSIYTPYAIATFSPPLEFGMLHPHNLGLAVWINLGILGLLGFIAIVIQWWRIVITLSSPLWRASLGATMAAVLIHGLVDTPYFKNDLAAEFWILITISLILYGKHKHSSSL